tara:strand:- start:5330 stop:5545 length:216 start_codon:yes stop_codon:yes gene_type:complete
MSDSKNNPIGLVFGVALVGVVLGALSTRLMLSERTEGPLFALYERVDGVIILLWLIIGLLALAGGVTYATV